MSTTFFFLNVVGLLLSQSLAFTTSSHASRKFSRTAFISSSIRKTLIPLKVSTHNLATEVTGEELEILLAECDQPLVVDAFATWCGPCLMMAPEFEEAAKELDGKVRFVKIDTDKEPDISATMNILGLPTLLFIDENKSIEGQNGEGSGGKPILKHRFEGALQKDSIVSLCKHYFFGEPLPDQSNELEEYDSCS